MKNFTKQVVHLLPRLVLISIALMLLSTSVTYSINQTVDRTSSGLVYANTTEVPAKQTGLVLGALVHSDGTLSDMLKDRCETAVELYKAGKIQKILVSGDHGTKGYDEVNAMKTYILAKGVPGKDLFLDHAGFDTYDSVYRAKAIFDVQSVTIITQEFHLPRALYIAKSLGMDAIGVKADRSDYGGIEFNQAREVLSKDKAFVDVTLQSGPKFLGPEIPITGDSKKSWD
jgi:SanA protein